MHLRVFHKSIGLVYVVSVVIIASTCSGPISSSRASGDELDTRVDNPDRRATASGVDEYDRDVLPLLQQYCFDCHADGADEGELSLDEFPSTEAAMSESHLWWTVLKNVRADVMPPEGEDQPSDAEKRVLFDWITEHVSGHEQLDPGPGTLRRLNRMEYRNTIRDLMGIEFDTSVEFPPDDSGDGFDNNADALSISPLLAEKYIEAAIEIVARAVPQTTRVIPVALLEAEDFDTDIKSKAKRLPFDKSASATATFELARDAKYHIVVPVEIKGSFDFNPERARIRLMLDGKVLYDREHGWSSGATHEVSFEGSLTAGQHTMQFQLDALQPHGESNEDVKDGTYVRLDLSTARIEGPLDPEHWIHPDGYDRFFHRDAPPEGADQCRQYASEILRRFCLRAYRRPVDERDLSRLLDLAGFSTDADDTGLDDRSFEQRIGRAMTAVLASPHFLFRVDHPQSGSTDEFPLVDEYSLASRLSYFLWSTMPDDELFRLAEAGNLFENLSDQVQRMLRDERSESLVDNFVGQWLQTRDVESISIDPLAALGLYEEYEQLVDYLNNTEQGRRSLPEDASPEHVAAYKRYLEIRDQRNRLDGDVRRDMATETKRLFSYVLRQDRSLLELIESDYAFLNKRLARHYGVPGVDHDEIRKTQLPPDSPLGGILTQGTFLVVTSNPTRTSPVKRGLFILDNILGTPAPPAPAMVPELEESAGQSKVENPTNRQLLELHRSAALCSSCHSRFDPLGLAFENFTAIGTWRDEESGQPIQPSGRLISGESFETVTQLKGILAGPRHADFYRCLSERMLSYAIGRSLQFGDEVSLEQISQSLEDHQGRSQQLISGVVSSPAFRRMRPAVLVTRSISEESHFNAR